MKFTHPPMGNLVYLTYTLIEEWGLKDNFVPPAPYSEKSLRDGIAVSPEWACLPLKATIGNFIEMISKGVKKFIMFGGRGPCRFGYYALVQDIILKREGYKVEIVVLEPPSALGIGTGWLKKVTGLWQFFKPIKKLTGLNRYQLIRAILRTWPKAVAFDELEREVLKVRCYETKRGSTNKTWEKAKQLLKETPCEKIKERKEEAFKLIAEVPKDLNKPVLKIGLIGEFFILLEPFFNFDIENWLSRNGALVARGVYITDWLNPNRKDPVCGLNKAQCLEMAKPELDFAGGESVQDISHTKHYAKLGFDGVLHFFPAFCMPDTIAKCVLPKISQERNIPIYHITIDEQTGKAGVETRLEAFLDLVRKKKEVREKCKVT